MSVLAVIACVVVSAGLVSAQQLGAFSPRADGMSSNVTNVPLNATLAPSPSVAALGENISGGVPLSDSTPTPTPTVAPPYVVLTQLNVGDNGITVTPNEYTFRATASDTAYNSDMATLAQNMPSVLPADFFKQYGLQSQVVVKDNADGQFSIVLHDDLSIAVPRDVSNATCTSNTQEFKMLTDMMFYINQVSQNWV